MTTVFFSFSSSRGDDDDEATIGVPEGPRRVTVKEEKSIQLNLL